MSDRKQLDHGSDYVQKCRICGNGVHDESCLSKVHYRLDEAETVIDRLRDALRRYGGHEFICSHEMDTRDPCNCGWTECLLPALEGSADPSS